MRKNSLLRIFNRHKQGENYFWGEGIPERKKKNSKNAMNISAEEEILCIIDNTAFGSAKEGVVFTDKKIYSKTAFNPARSITYSALLEFDMAKPGKSNITLKNNNGAEIYFDLLVTEVAPECFMNIIQDIIRLALTDESEQPDETDSLPGSAPVDTLELTTSGFSKISIDKPVAPYDETGEEITKSPELIEPLTGGLKKAMDENISKNEVVHAALNGNPGEALIVTDERIIIIKAGFSSGAMFGQKAKSFLYEHITTVEVSCGLIEGRIQITTPGTIEATHGWRQFFPLNASIDANQAENVVTFTRDQKNKFQIASEIIRNLISLKKKPRQILQQQIIQQNERLPDMLKKIAELKELGIISEEEYQAKKKSLLERM